MMPHLVPAQTCLRTLALTLTLAVPCQRTTTFLLAAALVLQDGMAFVQSGITLEMVLLHLPWAERACRNAASMVEPGDMVWSFAKVSVSPSLSLRLDGKPDQRCGWLGVSTCRRTRWTLS
jgi:hypothetical protein